jgi:hypothetical protein
MLSQSIWWASIALELLVLVRAFRGKLASRFPVFYCYVGFVVFEDIVSFLVYRFDPKFYPYTYWTTEFLCVLIGCGIVFEIYRVGLMSYPGTARMARNFLAILFILAAMKGLRVAANDPQWWLMAGTLALERTLRVMQAICIAALVALFLFYSIPFGKNLRGILLGYGFFIGMRVISLTFFMGGGADASRHFWGYAYTASYLLSLSVWCVYLWSYEANPVAQQSIHLEQEYQRIAAATQRRLRDARSYVAKAVGS